MSPPDDAADTGPTDKSVGYSEFTLGRPTINGEKLRRVANHSNSRLSSLIFALAASLPDSTNATGIFPRQLRNQYVRVQRYEPASEVGIVRQIGDPAAIAYAKLQKAIRLMAEADPEEDFWIEENVAEEAELLAALLHMMKVAPPRVFSHGGDAVAFTWEHKGGRRFLSIGGDTATVRDYSDAGDLIDSRAFDRHDPGGQLALAQHLGGTSSPSSFTAFRICTPDSMRLDAPFIPNTWMKMESLP